MAKGSIDVQALTGTEQTWRWNVAGPLGTPVVVTYSFASKEPAYDTFYMKGLVPFGEGHKADVRAALDEWASISGLTFIEIPEIAGAGGQMRFSMVDLGGQTVSGGGQVAGRGSFPHVSWFEDHGEPPVYSLQYDSSGGDIWLHSGFYASSSSSLARGSDGYRVLLHEIGHAIGFKHPHEGDRKLNPALDNLSHTVMTYNISGQSFSKLGSLDIAAAQLYYGRTSLPIRFDSKKLTLEITGTKASQTILGTELRDTLRGLAGNDLLRGDPGNDLLFGGSGNDTIRGGAGNDRLFGESGNDDLHGGDGGWDADGDNLLDGGSGNDTLQVRNGDNTLIGGKGADRLIGGFGVDTASYATAKKPIVLLLDDLDSSKGDAKGDTFELIDRFVGSRFNDRIQGEKWAVADLAGGAGKDQLIGGNFDDTIGGGGGNDFLRGGDGGDQLSGGGGKDILEGGFAKDTLLGGKHADKFVIKDVNDSTASGFGRDFIMDFRQVQNDKIALKTIDADVTRDRNNTFDFIGEAKFSGTAGELRSVVKKGATFVYGDVDGDGRADFGIKLAGAITLTAEDFVL